MAVSRQVFFIALAISPLGCLAHWRLTKPIPRSAGAYENNPLSPDANTKEEWVCRNANPNPNVERPTVEADKPMGIVYGTGSIGHVGDCAVYISYDVSRARRTMRWVKIANLPDCRQQINQLVHIDIPSVLPEGDAVFRWDQAATHQIYNSDPFVEWFIQCADIFVSSSSTRSWDSFNSFSMIDNNGVPAYPASVSKYRKNNQAAVNDADFWMTGPACVDDSINQCALTAVGTRGYTGFGGESDSPVVSSSTANPGYGVSSSATTSTLVPDSLTSSVRASTSNRDAMCCYDPGCSTYGTSFCNPIDSWCSASVDACTTCGGTLCVETKGGAPVNAVSGQAPEPEPETKPEPEFAAEPESESAAEPEPESEPEAESEPAPAAEPEPESESESEPEPESAAEAEPQAESQSTSDQPTRLNTPVPSESGSPVALGGRCCFYGGCVLNDTTFCYGTDQWCAASPKACSTCAGQWCSDLSLASNAHARKRKFLRSSKVVGNSLVQTSTDYEKRQSMSQWNWSIDEL